MGLILTMYLSVVAGCLIVYLGVCAGGNLQLTPMQFTAFMGISIVPGLNVLFIIWCISSMIYPELVKLKTYVKSLF